MQGALDALIAAKPSANGLAIIVVNEASCRDDHKFLFGAAKDLEAIKEAFEFLRFATLPIKNASGQQIVDLIQAAAARPHYPATYKRLAFVFSGHGDHQCIYAHDSEIPLQKYIFDPWLPKTAPHLAKIPKLFFFDACRGSGEDVGVPIKIHYSTAGMAVAKGGRTPSVGNYLLACSTLPSMQAYEDPALGGYWMQHLSKELQSVTNKDCSLGDILTKVRRGVVKEMGDTQINLQQPVTEDTLLDLIYPIREAIDAG